MPRLCPNSRVASIKICRKLLLLLLLPLLDERREAIRNDGVEFITRNLFITLLLECLR